MYHKVLWCYLFILTLLDISLNTKLTAQGESHGVTIHESLVEGITFQEWGKESGVDGLDGIDGGTENIEGVSLEPRALKFGRSALAAPHSRIVTLTNTANTTLHLASVAGTTPDFHASFFESKTLPPQGNTTFNVVYLGRREGPVSAHLYIHTSLGVHKYPVSAVGEASEYAVWPLLGLRVPLNATVEPELRLHNPTARTVQVREVYSSGAWLRLRLPGGGARAPRDAWAVPPRSERALVLLRAHPHRHAALNQPLIAYVRIKADIPGGGLVVAVEARSVPAGEHARPLHVRLSPRGSRDAPYTVALEAANSGSVAVSLEGGVRGAGCWRGAPPPLPCAAPPPAPDPRRQNGAAATGATLTLERTALAPHQPFTRVATLTLNYTELWAQTVGVGGAEDAGDAEEAWCAGCARLGRAHVPFSVRLLPGALSFTPDHIDVVTAAADALREHTLRARNDFAHAVRVHALHVPPELAEHFHIVEHTPLTLRAGAAGALLRLRLRARPPAALALGAALRVHTDLARYSVPVRLYSGKLIFEWDWVNATSESLELGTVGTSWTRRVGVRLRNPAPAPLCLAALGAALPGAAATLTLAPPRDCVAPGAWAQGWLAVVAPAHEASLRGAAFANTSLAGAVAALALRVRAGHVRALALRLPPAAPYAGSSAELEVESSMAVRMRVTALQAAPPRAPDPALHFDWEGPGRGEVAPGLQRVATVSFAPERRCEPRCYTGLDPHTEEGAAWARRGARWDEAALREDAALLQARLARYAQHAAAAPGTNFTLHLHTTEVLQIVVSGSARLQWPRLAAARAGAAALAAVRRAVPLRLALRNPAHVPLLLHALPAPAAAAAHRPDLPPSAGGDSEFCTDEKCIWSRDAFNLTGWRATRGEAREYSDTPMGEGAMPMLLLQPHAEIELSVTFSPPDAGSFTTYLYLRNNLTILEGVQLYGQGEYPRFDIGGKRPGTTSPFLFEVRECSWSGVTGGGGAAARRLVARNAGRVRVTLAGWSVARGGCAARGWRLAPCAPLHLAPNASAPLHLAFAPDYSLSRLTATLHLDTDLGPAEYVLMATIPAKVLAQCAAIAPRPPWEGLLRSAGTVLAFAAFALVLAAATLDAERLLRRARAARPPAPPHAPLDLRRLAPPAPAPAPTPPRPAPRRRRAQRRPAPLDPRAERRAFERWRAEVLRREDDSSRSSEDADLDLEDAPPAPRDRSLETPLHDSFQTDNNDVDDGAEDAEPTPADEEGGSTGSDVSTPAEDRDDADEPYGGDVEPDPRDDSPTEGCDVTPTAKPLARPPARTPPVQPARARGRRSVGEDGETRRERVRAGDPAERRVPPARHHTRKERAPRRRERALPSPPPRSPAPGAGAEAGARSWSAVVSGPPLAPIGSDVRRREPDRTSDNSLFYFNGTTDASARPDTEFAWRPPVAADRPAFAPPRDYLVSDETHTLGVGSVGSVGSVGGVGGVGAGYGVGLGSVWGGGGWGAWGAGPLRPPPGFAPPSPPAQRSYDPFQSLASIWAPAPHEWRPAPSPAPAPATPTHAAPARDRDDHN